VEDLGLEIVGIVLGVVLGMTLMKDKSYHREADYGERGVLVGGIIGLVLIGPLLMAITSQ
jgi:hypothetical protein